MIISKRKRHTLYKSLLILALPCLTGNLVKGQVLSPFQSGTNWINQSEILYRHQIYGVSALAAQQHIDANNVFFTDADPILQKDRAFFLKSVSGIKSKGKVSETDIPGEDQPFYREMQALALAQSYFRKGEWNKAINWYEKAGITNLNNEQVANSKFELAYCYFNNKNFNEAEQLLRTIKDSDGPYKSKAQYYFGLLAYNKGNYPEALKCFESIEQEETYKNVVPYYIAEINYFSGSKETALQKALAILNNQERSFYEKETQLLAAQCFFEKEQWEKAIPHFEYYYSQVDKIRKQDLYKLGYSYYQTQRYEKAVEPFEQLSSSQDVLGQTAMYLLGACNIKLDNKTGAKNAFSICSQMPYNEQLIEPALLLSGRLAFELGYSKEGSEQLRKLMQNYPQSAYRSEAAALLSVQLLETGDYNEAYQLLRTYEDQKYDALFQQAAYGYAMQCMQGKKWQEAESLLDQSIARNASTDYEALAYFWKSEAEYYQRKYTKSISDARAFLGKANSGLSRISNDATPTHALMTMGYAALENDDYKAAQEYFAQAQSKGAFKNERMKSEALMRQADAAFLQKEYEKASELYTKAISEKSQDADYALFQKSTLLGLQGRSAEQASLLMQIVAEKNPESKYKYEAHYALGDLYLDANKFEDAINNFQKINEQTAKHLALKALIKTAYAYQEAGNSNKAIEIYKKAIESYPNSDQRGVAMDALKSLHIQSNQPNAYARFLKEQGMETDEAGSLDSVYYAAGESLFSQQVYKKAKEAFGTYLAQYPKGFSVTKAHFYKAESHIQLKENDSALIEYDQVLSAPWTDFTEPAAQKAALIALDKKDYVKAGKYFESLRQNAVDKDNLKTAFAGLMEVNAKTEKWDMAKAYADTLNQFPDLAMQTKEQVGLVLANDAFRKKDWVKSKEILESLKDSKNIDVNAESNYRLTEILLKENKLTEAEDKCNILIKQSTSSSYWNAKAYLLIADIYIAQKDYFNAKATLQSLIKYLKIEELKKLASEKLDAVKQLEKGKSKLSEG